MAPGIRRLIVGSLYLVALPALYSAIPRAIDGSEFMITIAGSGWLAGYSGDGGPATAASLSGPQGVAVAPNGDVYVADTGNHRIRMIVRATETIVTIAGSLAGFSGDGGPAVAARLNQPQQMALDLSGNLYIADTHNHRIRRVDISTGVITTVAGNGMAEYTGDDGPATAAGLNMPSGVAVDAAGNIFIADTVNFRVRRVAASTGIITTVGGNGAYDWSGDGGPATSAGMQPYGVAIDQSGNLFIADTWNNRIRRIAAATGTIETVAGTGLPGLNPPYGPSNRCIGQPDGSAAISICLYQPRAVVISALGEISIADSGNHRIRKVSVGGTMTTVAGSVSGFSGDRGPATLARLASPAAIAVDALGNLLAADTGNMRIRQILAAAAPVVTLSPGPRVAPAGYGISFTADAIGGPNPATQWQVSSDGGTSWTDVAGATTRSYSFVTALADDGKLFRAMFTNTFGTVYSSAGRLSIRRPVGSDLDGDGAGDLVIYREASFSWCPHCPTTWYWLPSQAGYGFAAGRAIAWQPPNIGTPFVADTDGDGIGDPVLWDALNGNFYWLTSSNGYRVCAFYESNCNAPTNIRQWGHAGDVPLVGDMDGDARADFVIWRPSTGTWYWLTSSSGYVYGNSVQWGNGAAGDKPLLADMDGDGKMDPVVWRGSTGTWYWLTSTTGYDATWGGHGRQWGNQTLGDMPLVGDFDGDGVADLAVWRASTGTWYWLSSSGGYAYAAARARQWGASGDLPMITDIDVDGLADLIVWRASTGTWYWLRSSAAYSYTAAGSQQWGHAPYGDVPLV